MYKHRESRHGESAKENGDRDRVDKSDNVGDDTDMRSSLLLCSLLETTSKLSLKSSPPQTILPPDQNMRSLLLFSPLLSTRLTRQATKKLFLRSSPPRQSWKRSSATSVRPKHSTDAAAAAQQQVSLSLRSKGKCGIHRSCMAAPASPPVHKRCFVRWHCPRNRRMDPGQGREEWRVHKNRAK